MLHVAMLVDSPSEGTYANAVGRLAIGLSESGRVDTSLVCYRDGPRPTWLPDAVRIHRLGTGRASASIGALRRYLSTDRPDVLISRQIHVNIISLLVSGLARFAGGWRGRLVLFHDHPAELSHASNWRDNKWLVKYGYRFAAGVVSPSPGVREDIVRWCRLYPGTVGVVANPIDIFGACDRLPPHPWLGHRWPVFLTVSHLVGWKRLDLVLEAFAQVRRRHDARLLLVGQGVERTRLEAQIERLRLGGVATAVGWVADPRQFAARATALVHASDEEGFAQVLIEAMSTGCPVIAADALGGGPRYVTDDGRYGMLVPRGSVPELVKGMESMLVPEVRERYATLAAERAKAFKPLASATALLDFLEHLGIRSSWDHTDVVDEQLKDASSVGGGAPGAAARRSLGK